MKMKFKDAPIGARFKFLGKVFVKLNSHPKGMFNDGNGLIVQWNGNIQGHQSHCCWVDKENGIDFETEIELI